MGPRHARDLLHVICCHIPIDCICIDEFPAQVDRILKIDIVVAPHGLVERHFMVEANIAGSAVLEIQGCGARGDVNPDSQVVQVSKRGGERSPSDDDNRLHLSAEQPLQLPHFLGILQILDCPAETHSIEQGRIDAAIRGKAASGHSFDLGALFQKAFAVNPTGPTG